MKVRVKVLCVKTYEVDVELPSSSATKEEIEEAAVESFKTDYNTPLTVDYQVEGIVPC